MKEYYLVMHYWDIINNHNGYDVVLDHKNRKVECSVDNYHFDIQIEYKWVDMKTQYELDNYSYGEGC